MSFKLMKRVSDMEDRILAVENSQSASEPFQSAIKRIDGEIKMLKARMAKNQSKASFGLGAEKEEQHPVGNVENYE